MIAPLVEHADGVYLNMPSERYHADIALGSGAIKEVLSNPLGWWWDSSLNTIEPPPVDEEEVKHLRLGTAVHVALLEGTDGRLDAYEKVYGIHPSRETHPNALVTTDHIKERLARYHLSQSGLKGELIRRLRTVEPHVEVLDDIVAEWRLDGRRMITGPEDRRIRLLHALAHASQKEFVLPDGETQTLREAFVGGLAEVSVFWTDADGIRQRARFDKLREMVTIDLKTFSAWRKNLDFDKSLLDEVKRRGYWLQLAHYQEARIQLRRLVAEGLVFGGTPAQRAELDLIAESDVWAWLWIFAVTQGYPHMKGVKPDISLDPITRVDAEDDGSPGVAGAIQYGRAIQDREAALAKFIYYREMFGLERGVMWLDPVPIWEPSSDDWGYFAG